MAEPRPTRPAEPDPGVLHKVRSLLSKAESTTFPDDQSTVELLCTSLLVQATSAMLHAGTSARTRSRAYRQAFLLAFASRIGQRLREAAVAQAVGEAFPRLRSMRVTASDPAGFAAGRAAADRARLGAEEVRGRVRRLGG